MIFRAEKGQLLIFNNKIGITAYFSERELDLLSLYLRTNQTSPFIERLKELEILPTTITNELSNSILNEIKQIPNINSPKNSFSVPESLHIDITTICPLNCKQCYKNLNHHSKGTQNINNTMNFELFSSLIDQASTLKIFQIALGGGEPLIVKNISEYVQYVTQKDLSCTITTSGYGLDKNLLTKLIDANISHIQISLNGSNSHINSFSRDGFEYAISALELLSHNKIPFGINWVARSDNFNDFEQIIDLASSYNTSNINILRYKPFTKDDYIKYKLSQNEENKLIQIIRSRKKIKIKVDSAFSKLLCSIYPSTSISTGCSAGRNFIMIDSYGRFKPCSHIKSTESYDKIIDYWNNSNTLNILRNCEETISNKCKNCVNLNNCRGCRGICETLTGNLCSGENDCYQFVFDSIIN